MPKAHAQSLHSTVLRLYPPPKPVTQLTCSSRPPITRHHHLRGGRGLGPPGRPQSDVVRAEGEPHLLLPRVHEPRRAGAAAGPRCLPRLHREKLRTRVCSCEVLLLTGMKVPLQPGLSPTCSAGSGSVWITCSEVCPHKDRSVTQTLYIC